MLNLDPKLFSGGKVYQGYGSRRNARIYMEDCIRQNVPGFEIPSDDRTLIFEGWEALCDRFCQPIFFEKSPQILAHWGCLELILEWIKKTDFDVKIVALVRNPLSVLYSAQELFHTNPRQRQYGWVEIHENLLRFQSLLSPSQFSLYRYEDIIQNPIDTFDEICQFVGVERFEPMGANVHASSINKWESDPFFTLQLDESVKDMAKKLGYEAQALSNPEKPTPPLIQRMSRTMSGKIQRKKAQLRHRLLLPMMLRFKQIYS